VGLFAFGGGKKESWEAGSRSTLRVRFERVVDPPDCEPISDGGVVSREEVEGAGEKEVDAREEAKSGVIGIRGGGSV